MPGTVFTTLPEYLVACGILAVAQLVYVLFGFGAGLIAVGSLALMLPDIRDAVVLLLLVNLPAELAVVTGSWRAVRWRGLIGLGVGIVAGIPLGAAMLRRSEPTVLLALLGGVLVLVGLVFLILPRGRGVRWPSWVTPLTGLLSGVLTGLFGTGGPPLIVHYHLAGVGKHAFRGHLMTLFLMMTLVRVPSYAAAGLITRPRMISGLAVLPAVALGAWIGHRVHLTLSETAFRRLVSALLAVIGVLLLLRR